MNQSDCGTEPEILQYPEFALTDAYGIFSACIPEDYMEKLRQTAKNETARQAVLLAALSGALYAFEETETFRFQAGPEKDIRISMTGEAETPEDLLRQTLTQLIRPETAAAGPDSGEELLVSCNDRGSLYLLCAAQGRTAWIYRRDSYPSIALFGMHRLFTRMLEGILLRRKESLSALREAWNGEELGRQAVHQGERCQTEKRPLCERLRETAAQYPQRPALRDEEREYTFRDIWNGVVKTAAYLQRKNIAKGDRVYLSADYTGVTVICIYALFYLGAAYVPVNESFPEERKAYIAGFCTEGARIDESMKKEIAVLCADAAGEELLPFCGIRETDLPGYVIFTSGTTGTPKGVEITQDWILNMLSWYRRAFSFDGSSRLQTMTALTFDASVKNICMLGYAGTALMLTDNRIRDMKGYLRQLRESRVTHLNCTVTLLHELLEADKRDGFRHFQHVRYIITGAERFQTQNIKELFLAGKSAGHTIQIVNLYGPTECTDVATAYFLDEAIILRETDDIPIGKPIDNKTAYLLSKHGFVCPPGVQGQLILGGEGVAKGYVQQPDHPAFVRQAGGRVYFSGDLCVRDQAGWLHYIGRMDNQVKINGIRVDLDEIARAVEKIPGVKRCVCVYEQKRLIAFYLMAKDAEVSRDRLKREAAAFLPAYMLPGDFMAVEAFPQNANGKADVTRLYRAYREKAAESGGSYTETQRKVLRIWQDVTETQDIGLDENFFDAGGDSLSLFRLSRYLEEAFQREFSPVLLMEYSTVRRISSLIEEGAAQGQDEAADTRGRRSRNLSAKRKRLIKEAGDE